MVKVRFLKSPTCEPYLLAYSVGQIGEVTKDMGDLLVKNGIAEVIEKPKPARKKTTKK